MNEKAMRRKTQILFLLAACLIVALQPMAFTGISSWDVAAGWRFYSGTTSNSGPVTFNSAITATQIQLAGGLVMFTNFNMGTTWSSLGFHTPQGATMEVQSVSTNRITCDVNPGSGLKTWNIYVGSKELPESVTGADYWDYWAPTQTVSVSSDNVATISLSWPSSAGTSATTSINILDQFLQTGNLLGGINAVFVNRLGLLWYVLLLLAPSVVVYQRFGAFGALLIWVLFWGTFQAVIPSQGVAWAAVLMVIALGGLIVVLYFGRRSPIA